MSTTITPTAQGPGPTGAITPAWETLEPGTRIRVGFQESARNGTFLRMGANSCPELYGDSPVIYFTNDAGREETMVPARGEVPRPAR